MKSIIVSLMLVIAGGCASGSDAEPDAGNPTKGKNIRLGNFSISLVVKDLGASRAFYEKVGFHVIAGNGRNYSILQNETSTIGLFQGMFKRNTLTFNPGWDRAGAPLSDFEDVREIQRTLKERGLVPVSPIDESTSNPASFMLLDPDGNPILVDQHVPRLRKSTK